jgi:hypothetical protein
VLADRIELIRGSEPLALLTWHLPAEGGGFYPIAFQFAEDVDDETKRQIVETSKRSVKIADKGFKTAQFGSSDHFGALPKPLGRLGFRARAFGAAQHGHVLDDRPIEGV